MHIFLMLLKWAWIAFLGYQGISYVLKHRGWLAAYKRIDFRLFLSIIPLLVLTILSAAALFLLNGSIFGWSWLLWAGHLFGSSDVHAVNLSLVGTTIPFLGIGLCVLLLIQLPSLALVEERWFRKGTLTQFLLVSREVSELTQIHKAEQKKHSEAFAVFFLSIIVEFFFWLGLFTSKPERYA